MPDVDVRTFGSDVKSMAESGGGAPKSYQPAAPAPVASQPIPQQEEKKSFSEVFETPGGMSPMPAEMPPAGMQEFGAAPKSKKGLFVGILVLIVVVGLGAIGYFYIYPTFFGTSEIETPPPVTQEPETQAPTPPIVPQVPVVGETTTTTSTATTTEETPVEEPGVPVVLEYKSLFKTSADISTKIVLSPINAESYRGSLEFSTAQVPILKEVIWKFGDGESDFTTFNQFSSLLVPDFLNDGSGILSGSFNPLFTFFTYTNDKGTWPGYIASLNSNAVSDIKDKVKNSLEASTGIKNLYLTDPGTAAAWKSGTTEGVSNRYSAYTLSGAGLNYGWLNDTLVVGTSYAGFQEALKRLK